MSIKNATGENRDIEMLALFIGQAAKEVDPKNGWKKLRIIVRTACASAADLYGDAESDVGPEEIDVRGILSRFAAALDDVERKAKDL